MTTLLKYYQSLLKSIPATLQTAEKQVNQKIRLTGLTDTGGAILQIIIQQKELAARIERHIEFFIKWDRQAELGLPQPLKDSLRQMPEYINQYLDILTLQADNLRAKNTLKYTLSFDQEQELYEKLNKLFDRSIYSQPKKSALYNIAYSAGKIFKSPISKMLHLLFITLVLSFPSVVMETLPLIQPRQATTISAPRLNAEEFANSMRKYKWQCRVINAGPDRPTIIIKEDEHGTPEYEIAFAKQALNEHNINFLAVEGWAGESQDKERGYTILNAEEDFLKEILASRQYYKIALEDADLQEECLKLHIFYQYTYSLNVVKERKENYAENQKQIERFTCLKKEHEKKLSSCPEEEKYSLLSDIRSDERMIKFYSNMAEQDQKQIQIFTAYAQGFISSTNKRARELGINKESLNTVFKEIMEKSAEELKQLNDEVTVNKRSKLWAQKVASSAESHNSIIVVMGRGHTELFLKYLKQFGEYNIVIVSPYPE